MNFLPILNISAGIINGSIINNNSKINYSMTSSYMLLSSSIGFLKGISYYPSKPIPIIISGSILGTCASYGLGYLLSRMAKDM